MKIYHLTNWKRFHDFILEREGNIWYLDRKCHRQDLKALVRYLRDAGLEDSFRFPAGIEISVELQQDLQALFRYIVNDGRIADFSMKDTPSVA